MHCRINDWAISEVAGDAFDTRVSLTCTLIDAKSQRPMSKISGKIDGMTPTYNDRIIDDLAAKLGVALIKGL